MHPSDKLFGTDEEAEDCIFYVIQTRHDTDNSIMDWTSLGLTYISEKVALFVREFTGNGC